MAIFATLMAADDTDPVELLREMSAKIIADDPTHECPICHRRDLPPHVHPIPYLPYHHGDLRDRAAVAFADEINALIAKRRGGR